MTSFAFILGVVPLVVATGAGAEMRRSLGVAVFAGMLGVTLFGVFLTPVFFYVIQWLGGPAPAQARPVPQLVAEVPGREWLTDGGTAANTQVTASRPAGSAETPARPEP
jgi:multidrug efflux pump